MRIYDVTVPLSPATPVFPGDPPISFRRVSDIAAGDPFTVTEITLTTHSGTHIDAPAHFIEGGTSIDLLPPLEGLAVVVSVAGSLIDAGDIPDPPADLRFLILKTGWGPREYEPGHPVLTVEGARRAVEAGYAAVGIDTPSVEQAADSDVHRLLLSSGIPIIENLDLSAVDPGLYRLLALPLKIAGGDGAPARVILTDP